MGDCGLTWQEVDGTHVLEIGYHVTLADQGSGYATEAAKACPVLALGRLDAGHVTTIINPENAPSRRVAEKLGMTLEFETTDSQARLTRWVGSTTQRLATRQRNRSPRFTSGHP